MMMDLVRNRAGRALAIGFGFVVGAYSGVDSPVAEAPAPAAEIASEEPKIQVALLLDTSSSMDGLVRQAKTRLWSIVNEFADYTKDGRRPTLEIAVYEYGRNTLPEGSGHIRLVAPLTQDLDLVYDGLFELRATKISGSNEYCGWVIRQALRDLEWSDSTDDLKAIYIAGNETFRLGPVDNQESCGEAIERGIMVSTIFCGSASQGRQLGWEAGADRADGLYMAIDQDQIQVTRVTPYDDNIRRLNVELNETLVPYGEAGISAKAAYEEREQSAEALSQDAVLDRAAFKAGRFFVAPREDLVELVDSGKLDWQSVELEKLPELLRNKEPGELKASVTALKHERAAIQAKLSTLSAEREEFLAKEPSISPGAAIGGGGGGGGAVGRVDAGVGAGVASGTEASLEEALKRSLRVLAARKGYVRDGDR